MKTLENTTCLLGINLAWAVSANNGLYKVYDLIPEQLVFGHNPNLPNNWVNRPLALGVTNNTYCRHGLHRKRNIIKIKGSSTSAET